MGRNIGPSADPEPIEAEFEPTAGTSAERKPNGHERPSKRSRSATHAQLALASLGATTLGAVIAIVVANTGSGSANGTLATEIDGLKAREAELGAKVQRLETDLVAARARLEKDAIDLGQRKAGEDAARIELSALGSQISALIGSGEGRAVPGALANQSPLGAVLNRVVRLEDVVRADAVAPETTAQMSHAVRSLSEQVAALDAANADLAASLKSRAGALSALEAGLVKANADIDALRAGPGGASPASPRATGGPIIAAAQARKILALGAIEVAAQNGKPFVNPHRALAAILPGDADVLAISDIARRGAPSLAQLRRDFPSLVRKARQIAANEADDGWNWLRASTSGVLALDPAPINARLSGLLASASRSIDVGDLRGAIEAIDGLPGGPAAAFKAWKSDALLRAELDERLDVINARLLASASLASGG